MKQNHLSLARSAYLKEYTGGVSESQNVGGGYRHEMERSWFLLPRAASEAATSELVQRRQKSGLVGSGSLHGGGEDGRGTLVRFG